MQNCYGTKKFLASTKEDPVFITKRFTYWKDVTTTFQKHQSSECHQEATDALILLHRQTQGNTREMFNHEHQAEKQIIGKSYC